MLGCVKILLAFLWIASVSFCVLLWPSGEVKGQHNDPSVAAGGAPAGLLPGAHASGQGHRPAHMVSTYCCFANLVTSDLLTVFFFVLTGICRDWRPIRKLTPDWCSASGSSRPCWTPGVLATLAAWRSTNLRNWSTTQVHNKMMKIMSGKY